MPLTKKAPRLLRIVRNEPHATQEDHHESLPTPPGTNTTRSTASKQDDQEDEDIYREPDSDSDEPTYKAPAHAAGFHVPKGGSYGGNKQSREPVLWPPTSDARSSRASVTAGSVDFKAPRPVTTSVQQAEPAAFRHSILDVNPPSVGEKHGSDEEHASSDSDPIFNSSQGSAKRLKSSFTRNVHAATGPTSNSRKPTKLYGKTASQQKQRVARKKSISDTNQRRAAQREEAAAAPQFTNPKGQDMFVFGSKEDQPQWQRPGGSAEYDSSLDISSLSSAPSSPDVEEVQALNLPPPKPYSPMVECSICGQDVNKFLREDFENTYIPGGQLSYKWQQRFCTYHKREEGKQLWQEKQYPEIDWNRFEERMHRHDVHLLAIIGGSQSSYYRAQLNERLKQRSKDQRIAKEKERSRTGYYGPRGEKIMAEYIVAQHSETLRRRATKDRLIAAAGISGGVSGFVQAVLVPELAQQLVIEDMNGGSEDDARRIIADSAELGELINPEAEERVTEVVELK